MMQDNINSGENINRVRIGNFFRIIIISIVSVLVLFICATGLSQGYKSSNIPTAVREFQNIFNQVEVDAQDLNTLLETGEFKSNLPELAQIEDNLNISEENLKNIDNSQISLSQNSLMEYIQNLNSIIKNSKRLMGVDSTTDSTIFNTIVNDINNANSQVDSLQENIRSEMRLYINLDELNISNLYLTEPTQPSFSTPEPEDNSSGGETGSDVSNQDNNTELDFSSEESQPQLQTSSNDNSNRYSVQETTTTVTEVTEETTYITEEITYITEEIAYPQEIQETSQIIEDSQPETDNSTDSGLTPTVIEGDTAYGNLILNKRSNKLHKYPGCGGVTRMRSYNKEILTGPVNLSDYDLCEVCFHDLIK